MRTSAALRRGVTWTLKQPDSRVIALIGRQLRARDPRLGHSDMSRCENPSLWPSGYSLSGSSR
jgi:hypothetical protein